MRHLVAVGLLASCSLAFPAACAHRLAYADEDKGTPCHFLKHKVKASVLPEKAPPWKPADFRGLVVGSASTAEVLALIGPPNQKHPSHSRRDGTESFEYKALTDPIAGAGVAYLAILDGRLVRVTIGASDLTIQTVIERLGPKFIVMAYVGAVMETEDEVPDGGWVCEAPEGPLCNVEYRDRGTAFAVNSRGEVISVSYLSAAGFAHHTCRK